MEQSLSQLWVYVHSLAAAAFGGFVTICGWLFIITRSIPTAKQIENKMDTAINSLHEIEQALKGDYEKKGLITKHYELERRVEVLESK